MADTIRTTHDTTANTTTTAPGTTAAYDAEAVRVGAAKPMATRETPAKSNASTKGLIVGVLTFVLLSLWEWLDGPTGAAGDAITFPEMAIYAVVGIIVGVAVKAIDKARHNKAHTTTTTRT